MNRRRRSMDDRGSVAPMRADFYSQCAKTYQTLMVPALFCENMCPMHKKLTCEIIGLMLSDGLLNTGGGVLSKLMPVPWLSIIVLLATGYKTIRHGEGRLFDPQECNYGKPSGRGMFWAKTIEHMRSILDMSVVMGRE